MASMIDADLLVRRRFVGGDIQSSSPSPKNLKTADRLPFVDGKGRVQDGPRFCVLGVMSDGEYQQKHDLVQILSNRECLHRKAQTLL